MTLPKEKITRTNNTHHRIMNVQDKTDLNCISKDINGCQKNDIRSLYVGLCGTRVTGPFLLGILCLGTNANGSFKFLPLLPPIRMQRASQAAVPFHDRPCLVAFHLGHVPIFWIQHFHVELRHKVSVVRSEWDSDLSFVLKMIANNTFSVTVVWLY